MIAYSSPLRAVGAPQPHHLLPPLRRCDYLSMEVHQGKLGYENHPTYDYLAQPGPKLALSS
jgi:hypothetical protein